ncbi:MAG: hypothetical protein KDK76_01795 [Chlamydiia bacterium]|nr:hypothetical protein [Chlamydiia bacterium]
MKNAIVSSALALGIYNKYQISRTYLVGQQEQKILMTLTFMGSVSFYANVLQPNLTHLFGEPFAKKVYKFHYLSYGALPTLHYATSKMENSQHETTKKVLNFTYVHIDDILLTTNAIVCLMAARKGFNRIGNLAQISLSALAVLDQGLFGMTPCENSGPSFKIFNKKVVRLYRSTFKESWKYLSIPISFFYQGIIGKITAIFILAFNYTPKEQKAKLISPEIKEIYEEIIKIQEKTFGPRPNYERIEGENLPQSQFWGQTFKQLSNRRQNLNFDAVSDMFVALSLPGEKLLTPLSTKDYFPDKELESLQSKVAEKINENPSLQSEDKEFYLSCLKENGLFHKVSYAAKTEALSETLTLYYKNIIGHALNHWEEVKELIDAHKDGFLCDPAIATEMGKISLKISLSLNNERHIEGTDLELEAHLLSFLQTERDYLFDRTLQMCSENFKDRVKATPSYRRSQLRGKTQEIDKFFPIVDFYTQNRHGKNLLTVALGDLLHPSDLETARADVESLVASSGLNLEALLEPAEYIARLVAPIFDLQFRHAWFLDMITALSDFNDDRLNALDVFKYFYAEDFNKLNNALGPIFELDNQLKDLQKKIRNGTAVQKDRDDYTRQAAAYKHAVTPLLIELLPLTLHRLRFIKQVESYQIAAQIQQAQNYPRF